MNFSELYGRYAHDVHRFALYLCGNESLAEDLTSETFVRALCGPTNLRLGTVRAYLFAITRNLYRDFVSKPGRSVETSSLPERHDPRPTPEHSAQGRQELQNAIRVIQQLPEQQREALLLALDGEMSYWLEDERNGDFATVIALSTAKMRHTAIPYGPCELLER